MDQQTVNHLVLVLVGFLSTLYIVIRNDQKNKENAAKATAIILEEYGQVKDAQQKSDEQFQEFRVETARREGTYVQQIASLEEALKQEKERREQGNVQNAKAIAALEERLRAVQAEAGLMKLQMEQLQVEREQIRAELETKKTELELALEGMRDAQVKAEALMVQVTEPTTRLNETQNKLEALQAQYGK